ncbi:MAG TPA: M20/M25/M40 family metallo-hydrolase [Blastocatellia bacterium]|nr:M20/M25/M40 family metallo-hydrolase [Blastocatellia bacterium]
MSVARPAVVRFACFLAICVLPISAGMPLDDVRQYVHDHRAEILQEFRELLSIPNVASDTVNIRRNAHKLVEMLEHRGVKARLLEGDGPPVVFGELSVAGAKRTIAIYVHYDGQPVDASKWNNDPFSPTLRDPANGGAVLPFPKPGDRVDPEWRLFARSASDDKAPIIAILQALDALKASGHPLTANLKFFFEGEEEAGSTHLDKLVMQNRALLDADVWICADGPVHQTRRQSLYFGCRGVVSATITIYGPDRPLHSGHYGNWAPNPAMRLAKLLASMKDDNGRVLIAGFYDGVEPLGEVEKKAIRDMPPSDTELMREYGLAETDGRGRPLAELITEPSLNIDGLRSEYVGPEARTIIPAEATATIDMRLVKGIEPEQQLARLIAHIKKQGYVVSEQEPSREMRLKYPLIARVTSSQGYKASRTRMDLPIAREIISAVTRASGRPPVLIPMLGGSTPMAIFESATGLPQIGVPIVNHDNNQHSSNENLRLQNLWDGIEVFAAIMTMD